MVHAGQANGPASARDRLLDSVIEHFTTEGLADQSLRRIAEAVGTSHRMLLYHFGSKDGLLLEVVREVEARTQAALAAFGEDAIGRTDELIRRMWAYVADPALGRLRAPVLRPLRAGPTGRRVDPAAAEGRHRGLARRQRHPVRPAGRAADVARTHARLGLAVTRGLLLDLLATGDRAEVEAALEVFARRYRGRWWEAESRAPAARRRHQRPRLVAAAVARRHREHHRGAASIRRLPSAMAVAWNP